MSTPELHPSIIALVSLSTGIASKHPDMGLRQLDKLRAMGIAESQIATVNEIARHIRDEAAQKLDTAFDAKADVALPAKAMPQLNVEVGASCCSTTACGQSCC